MCPPNPKEYLPLKTFFESFYSLPLLFSGILPIQPPPLLQALINGSPLHNQQQQQQQQQQQHSQQQQQHLFRFHVTVVYYNIINDILY